MRSFLIAFILFSGLLTMAQHGNNYYTPWYGAIGIHTISSRYAGGSNEITASLTYADVRAVLFAKKGYLEWGIPVAGYVLSGVVAKGKLPNDSGEVPLLFVKGGWDIVRGKMIAIGMGASLNTVLIDVKGIEGFGASLESYGTLSPLLYAKINIGSFLIVPVFEYNALSFTNTNGTTRPGFSVGSHCIIPISKRLGINLNPVFEKGTFKGEGNPMTSSSFIINAGLVVRPG